MLKKEIDDEDSFLDACIAENRLMIGQEKEIAKSVDRVLKLYEQRQWKILV